MEKILVVDNHPIMLKYLNELLVEQGYEVYTASDGLSALDVMKEAIPDVVFVDLIMPNIDGRKLCRIIRSMPELKHTCLVVLSGIAAEEELSFAEFGANACIAKGPLHQMKTHVLDILEQMRALSSAERMTTTLGCENIAARQITRELLSTKRHFEVIINNMSEGILEVTQDNRIVYANPSVLDLFGMPEEKLLGANFIELFSEDHRETVAELMDASENGIQSVSEDSPLNVGDKQAALNILPIEEPDGRSRIVILHDVSERKRIEKRLQQAQQMEAVATLARGIAHKFNNALFGITGNMELLQMKLRDETNIAKNLEAMKESVNKMADLNKQLLAYAQGGKYQPQRISVNAFVEDLLPAIRQNMDSSVQMTMDLNEGDCTVEADLMQLQMVLTAVVNNAVEAIDNSGSVSIRTRCRELEEEDEALCLCGLNPGSYVCLTVEDDGKGMDQETLNRIFEPFFTTKFYGRGLSMAATYGIVKNHNGSITVESTPGSGTVVQVYLPKVHS